MTKHNKFVSIAASIAIVLVTGCGGTHFSSKIADYYKQNGEDTKSVTILTIDQSYSDSWRSPNDTGKSTKLKARITWSNGKSEEKSFEVFVADSDGWTKVREN